MSRRNALIVGLASLALLAAWFFLLWSPKGAELEDARARRGAAEDRVEQLELRLAQLRAAERRGPELLVTAGRLRSAIPPTADLPGFLLATNDAAGAAGVDFLSVAPTPPVASTVPGAAAEIQVAVNVRGGYFRVLDFLDRLLAMPRVVVVDSFSAASAGPTADLAVTLTGRVFTTQQPETATPTPAAATTPTTVAASDAVAAGQPMETP